MKNNHFFGLKIGSNKLKGIAFVLTANEKPLKINDLKGFFTWYLQESNQGHKDFQSFALPTELRYQPNWSANIENRKGLPKIVVKIYCSFYFIRNVTLI